MENMVQHLHFANIYELRTARYIPKVYKNRTDHFSLPEVEFKRRYRFTKKTVLFIVKLIEKDIKNVTSRNHALSAQEMLLLTLRYYACGNFLITVGDYCGVSTSTACRVVKKVSSSLAKLSSKFICMPKNEDEKRKAAAKFFAIAKFPSVIGSIDCTHIRIQSPGGSDAELYRNRKGFFSFNVQAICNADLIINDVVARWPGSSHDSHIFNNSRIKARFESREFGHYHLLGDSGYAVKSYMMTPLQNPLTEAERLYNESQIRSRNVVERCFGVLKRRFPILSLGLRLTKETSMDVIVACAVLHNIARVMRESDPIDDNIYIEPEIENVMVPHQSVSSSIIRNNLINNYFARL